MKTKVFTALFLIGFCLVGISQSCGNPWPSYKKYADSIGANNAENSPTDGRISLRLAGNGSFVTILIGFIPEGTVNFDDGYDGPFINDGAVLEFYSFLGTTRLSIQALPELTNTDVQVALGCEFTSDGMYTISIDAEFLDPNFDIILEDSQQNVFTDLRQSSYTFSAMTGEVHDRFSLNLDYRSTLSVEEISKKTDAIHAYIADNTLKIHTQRTDIETITLHQISGKEILRSNFVNELSLIDLPRGVYILQYLTVTGEKIVKKLLK